MKCSNCQFENPPSARFCQNCGQSLERTCPICNTPNQPAARFCLNCGANLQAVALSLPAGDERLVRLVAAAPASLVEKMRAAPLDGERRTVTALFADVVGSTSLAEHMDPEDWTGIMNQAFDRLTPAIFRYEGTIARLMGDALLVFFGAPVAHEDDPIRAVRAALDMVAAARQYAEQVRREFGIDFAVRVGLSTGPVVVGEVGTDLAYEYTAMGDAVNLAARMQAAARPMTVLIAENTYRSVAPLFEFLDLGEIMVKGRAESVHAYEVTGSRARPGRMRGLAGLESPLVGREAELQALLAQSAAVQAGLGRAALVVGEAGLGKTRLVAEWRSRVIPPEGPAVLQWIEAHCLSYGQGLAYHLLIDLLRGMLGVISSDDATQTRAALIALCDDLFGSRALEVYPYLGHLLSVQLEGPALERVRMLDPQALQGQYQVSLRQLLQAMAVRRPLVLILEDLHWADPSSIDLLVKLLPLVAEIPLLVVGLTRPDSSSPGWKLVGALRDRFGAGMVEINLQALSTEDSCRMVSNMLEVEALPERLREMILQKAEGNPFFVEELIRMLIDHGVIVQTEGGWVAGTEIESIDLPDNLQSLLLARIDRLPEQARRVLRVAAVIGRQFPVRVLEQVVKNGIG